jgi:perosamine synthetase
MIPVNEPIISQAAKDNVNQALETGWLSSSGPAVKQFEQTFADYLDTRHAITVSSGTAALHVTLLGLGIGQGDEVIVPAFTMAASWMAIMYTGATPVFVDCELETYNIDIKQIASKITDKTKAIMAVHIYGHACEMDSINKIAKEHNLTVIEDAAEALAGEYKGKKCGTLGQVACFSFYANKIVTTGEGGMIVTNDDKLANQARKFKDLYHSDRRFIHEQLGYNYRMTNLQAAVGLGELSELDNYLAKKQRMASLYDELLSDLPGIKTPITLPHITNTFWMYSILIKSDEFGLTRDELAAKLKEQKIGTRDFFYSPQDQPVLKDIVGSETFPNTKLISERGLYLPSGLALTEDQIHEVCQVIKNIQK